jgi:hypothetical protein
MNFSIEHLFAAIIEYHADATLDSPHTQAIKAQALDRQQQRKLVWNS